MLRAMRAASVVLIAIVLAACILPPRLFGVVLTNEVAGDLPVTFEDRTGLVQVVGPAQPGQFNLTEGVTSQADPSVLAITWLGGACDLRAHLVFAGSDGAYSVTQTTDREGGPCTLQFNRTVTVGLSSPVDPGQVTLRNATP
jgi:hypothetical protein